MEWPDGYQIHVGKSSCALSAPLRKNQKATNMKKMQQQRDAFQHYVTMNDICTWEELSSD